MRNVNINMTVITKILKLLFVQFINLEMIASKFALTRDVIFTRHITG